MLDISKFHKSLGIFREFYSPYTSFKKLNKQFIDFRKFLLPIVSFVDLYGSSKGSINFVNFVNSENHFQVLYSFLNRFKCQLKPFRVSENFENFS